MGCGTSSGAEDPCGVKLNPDQYASYGELSSALRDAGLEEVQLMVGIDFASSKEDCPSLHDTSNADCSNPCEQALAAIAKALEPFHATRQIPVYGFGDLHSRHHGVFCFKEENQSCKDVSECLQRYTEIAKVVTPASSRSFAPLIRQALKHADQAELHHVLLILAAGDVCADHMSRTKKAIVEASVHKLSIVVIRIDSGPCEAMKALETRLAGQLFNNVHLVDVKSLRQGYQQSWEVQLAAHALVEVPQQYQSAARLGLLHAVRNAAKHKGLCILCSPPDKSRPTDAWYGLPTGWDAFWDDEKESHVYVNKKTGQRTWVPPSVQGSEKPSTPRLPRLLSRRCYVDMPSPKPRPDTGKQAPNLHIPSQLVNAL